MGMRKSIEEYRSIITDMDGTLYFQVPVRFCMAFEMLCHFWRFRDFLIIKRYREMAEHGIGELQRFTHLPPCAPSVIDEWMQKRPLKYIRFFRDRQLIAMLNKRQLREVMIVVYSDYPAIAKAKSVGLNADRVFCASDKEIDCMKPDPNGLMSILRIIDIEPEDALFIGDRYTKDGKCAESAGVDFVILGKSIGLHGRQNWNNLQYHRR